MGNHMLCEAAAAGLRGEAASLVHHGDPSWPSLAVASFHLALPVPPGNSTEPWFDASCLWLFLLCTVLHGCVEPFREQSLCLLALWHPAGFGKSLLAGIVFGQLLSCDTGPVGPGWNPRPLIHSDLINSR